MTQPQQKIVILTSKWLGDFIVGLGFIKACRAKFPDAVIDIVVHPGFEIFLPSYIRRVYPFRRKGAANIRLGFQLRREKYNSIFLLPPSASTALTAWVSGTRSRIGIGGFMRSLLLTDTYPLHNQHSAHLLGEYLKFIHAENEIDQYYPELPDTLRKKPAVLPESLPQYIVLCPGAIYGPSKQWGTEKFKATAGKLVALGYAIIITGTDTDRESGEIIKNGHADIHNLCGKTDLSSMTGIFAHAKAVISNDSGAMHIAAALGIPQIAVFGSTSPGWTSPLNKKAVVLQKNPGCAPCFERICRYGHYNCLNNIQDADVLGALKSLKIIP